MSDGVGLATDVYLPDAGTPPFPTILIRTPYDKTRVKGVAIDFCRHGYAAVVQDVRGRFASEGHHAIIYGNEGLGEHRDGHDTMNWIAAQSWSNKKIGTWGASAVGIVQNMAAPDAPEALKGQSVSVAFSAYYGQCAYQGGVWRKELQETWFRNNKIEDVNLPTMLAHPTYDDFWRRMDFEAHSDRVDAPGLYSGGWYDIFLQGTINAFTSVQSRGGPHARGKCFLVIGPAAHGPFTELTYPANSKQPPINTYIPWALFDSWLKGSTTPDVERLKPVHYYVMGDPTDPAAPGNVWRSADAWPPAADQVPFYLHGDRTLNRGRAPTGNDNQTYRYDPAAPVPTIGGQNLYMARGPMDQRKVESRGDVLLFTSPVLTEPLEVTGHIYAKLFVSSDGPDTDFTVKITDVYPDERSMLVADGIRRASLRNGYEKPEPLKAGEICEVEVDLWSTSLVFNKGHRIRVAVSSSNSPRFEPNANTGEPHPVPGKVRVAANTLYLSGRYPSHVILPIYRGEALAK